MQIPEPVRTANSRDVMLASHKTAQWIHGILAEDLVYQMRFQSYVLKVAWLNFLVKHSRFEKTVNQKQIMLESQLELKIGQYKSTNGDRSEVSLLFI